MCEEMFGGDLAIAIELSDLRAVQVKLGAADTIDRDSDGAYRGVLVQVEAIMRGEHGVKQLMSKLEKIPLWTRRIIFRRWRIDQTEAERGVGWRASNIENANGEVAEQAAIDHAIGMSGAIAAQDGLIKNGILALILTACAISSSSGCWP
jgi:hypothetical protein